MTRTEVQRTGFAAKTYEAGNRAGVAQFATHTPTMAPPSTSSYPYGQTRPTAGPTHRTALIGITGLALLLAAMGGIAFLRYQDTTTATVAATAAVTVPQSVYDSQVPTAPLGVTVAQSVYDSQVPTAPLAVAVPHGALAAQGADAAAAVAVPQSVYDSQVPTAPLGVSVAQSVYDSQVPAAPLAMTVPHGALAAQGADAAAAVAVPQSVYDSQVPEAAR